MLCCFHFTDVTFIVNYYMCFRYVELGSLMISTSGEDSVVTAVVLSRKNIAAALCVPEAVLVEWACLCGNDYTKPLVLRASSDELFRMVSVDQIGHKPLCTGCRSPESTPDDPTVVPDGLGVPKIVEYSVQRKLVRRARVELIGLKHDVFSLRDRVDVVLERVATLEARYGIHPTVDAKASAVAATSSAVVELQLDLSRQHMGSVTDLLKCALEIVDDES